MKVVSSEGHQEIFVGGLEINFQILWLVAMQPMHFMKVNDRFYPQKISKLTFCPFQDYDRRKIPQQKTLKQKKRYPKYI